MSALVAACAPPDEPTAFPFAPDLDTRTPNTYDPVDIDRLAIPTIDGPPGTAPLTAPPEPDPADEPDAIAPADDAEAEVAAPPPDQPTSTTTTTTEPAAATTTAPAAATTTTSTGATTTTAGSATTSSTTTTTTAAPTTTTGSTTTSTTTTAATGTTLPASEAYGPDAAVAAGRDPVSFRHTLTESEAGGDLVTTTRFDIDGTSERVTVADDFFSDDLILIDNVAWRFDSDLQRWSTVSLDDYDSARNGFADDLLVYDVAVLIDSVAADGSLDVTDTGLIGTFVDGDVPAGSRITGSITRDDAGLVVAWDVLADIAAAADGTGASQVRVQGELLDTVPTIEPPPT